jgi:hypothetical protein
MAVEDVALALMALDNQRVHWEVGHEDFSSLDGLDLTDDEHRLMVEATRDVETVDQRVALSVRRGDDAAQMIGTNVCPRGFGYWPPAMARAISYVRAGLEDPRLQAAFVAWQDNRGDWYP